MKLKTRKSIAKRYQVSHPKANRWGKRAKLIRKSAGQDHFNARESSTTTKKRRRKTAFPRDQRNIKRLMPYV